MKRSFGWLVVVIFIAVTAEGRVVTGDEVRVADIERVKPVLGKRLVMCEPFAETPIGTPGEPPTYTARYVKGVIIHEPILFDSSNHGYGWYLSANEPVDYAGGYLMAVYRKYNTGTTGEIGVAIWETADSLHNMMICGQLNANPPTGPGGRGRYPSAIATLEYPYALWTEFWDPAGQDPKYADGLMSVDELGWMQGFWTPPMDFAENSDPGIIYGLWVVMADFTVDMEGIYHIITCWEESLNSNYYTFIHGTSDDGIIWTFENASVDITPYMVPAMNHPQVAYGEDGFTIWMATGRLPEFEDFRILMGKSYDYGETWVDTIYHYTSFDMGIPNLIGDTLWLVTAEGDTVAGVIDSVYTGFTYDQDVTIAPDGSIHFVDTHVYFVKASSISPYWYWYVPYTGIFDFHSEDNGVTWTASKVADLNGFEPDDEEGEIETTNMVDIAADDQGNLYVAWTDRPDMGLVESPHSSNQYDDYYFRNIYCAVSTDGGYTWGEPIEVTNTPDIPEYSLHLCRKADSDKGGTIYIGFTVPDLTRPFEESPQMLADYVQWLYVVEINGLTVGVDEVTRWVDRFVVTPCIASDKVVINYVVGDEPNARLAVYDVTGRELKQIELKDRAGRYELDVGTLPQGTYFVRLTTGNVVREAKFVVIK